MMRAVCLIFAASSLCVLASRESEALVHKANPVRKVVNMMRNMVSKVEEEGKKEEELFEKFMCSCKTNGAELSKSVSDAEAKVPQLESSVEEGQSQKKQLDEDIKKAQTDRVAAKEAMAQATGIREKEAAAHAQDSSENKANLESMQKAIASLEKGMGGAFLQSKAAIVLGKLVQSRESMDDGDRESLTAFLSSTDADSENGPSSGEITGILKTMAEEMSKEIADANADEQQAIASYDDLIGAKTKEVRALSKAIEEKVSRTGDLAVSIVQMQNDLGDTEDALAEDKNVLAKLQQSCEKKKADKEEMDKTRSEELVALADTIKMLNSDDALDLFKKTLPSAAASLLQIDDTSKAVVSQALDAIHQVQKTTKPALRHLDFIALAMHGKKVGFEMVTKMIDNMIVSLKKEQKADNEKQAYCSKKFDAADDKKKVVERQIADLETVINEAEDGIAGLTEEIKNLKAGIEDLDSSVTLATLQRKAENSEFQETMSNDGAAKELLGFAKNRLNKFYNPKLAKSAAAVQVAAQALTAPAATAFVQIEAHTDYEKKSEESGGVIAMIDTLVRDLDKEMLIAKHDEKDAQEDYDEMIKDSAEKRAGDAKKLAGRQKTLADLQSQLEATTEEKGQSAKELMTQLEYIHSLHSDCDWLMQNFDVRKEARDSEIDALGKSKAVLSGADYSLVQTGERKFLKRN